MENITKFLKYAFSIIVFIVGIGYLILNTKSYHQSISQLRKDLRDNPVLYQQYVSEENIVSSAELMATLLHDLEYDIEIHGVKVNKQDHIAEKIDAYGIKYAEYQKTYEYDNYGNITKIIYSEHQ